MPGVGMLPRAWPPKRPKYLRGQRLPLGLPLSLRKRFKLAWGFSRKETDAVGGPEGIKTWSISHAVVLPSFILWAEGYRNSVLSSHWLQSKLHFSSPSPGTLSFLHGCWCLTLRRSPRAPAFPYKRHIESFAKKGNLRRMGESGLMKCPLGRLCEILLSPL